MSGPATGKPDRSRRPPTLEDVARAAGVSTATVSRSLNAPDRVRAETRMAVEAAVRDLGYTPNFGGQALASNRTNTIGAIIPTMENAIFARALQALQETLTESRVTLLVATSHYDPAREEAQIRALIARGVDGLALIGSQRTAAADALLETRGIPFVILWSAPSETPHPAIGFDNARAAAELTAQVLARGHRRIAMISGPLAHNDRAQARLAGVTETLCAAGLELAPGDLRECPYTLADGEAAAAALLGRAEPPTAIICGNDVLAAGALRAARRLGVDVPGALSVTGFDDIELATAVHPPLATIRVPHRGMGEAAGACLMDWIDSGRRPVSRLLPTEFVARGSLGPVG
ncbi:LacI family transcriptional regulator [Rhodovulum sulfidophilum]|uniref:LacI family DNA-binding transcriptional regulator n=1 Tax=Rhodovulum sulfidophilum TaxID=35806 RepID=UPI0005A8FBBF|nr:LacI family DNA-binding transcriptional regulator [Rhodovulum sulfidophilum]ANB36316.1 LacI family transcriptional regulator [Rhodovulum sulfidophilum DSM 1374]ANB40118.1 LacI family transcriptional regulator [Rhodovulum sulfidophilum]MCW2304710.1 LacI family transcriptional regulator [Rhodovulum sulfidophilum]